MSETIKIVVTIIILLIVWVLAQLGVGWWTSKISQRILKELESKGAVNAKTAVALPYEKANRFKIGFRDYRPKALELLVVHGALIRTEDGKYYINKFQA